MYFSMYNIQKNVFSSYCVEKFILTYRCNCSDIYICYNTNRKTSKSKEKLSFNLVSYNLQIKPEKPFK